MPFVIATETKMAVVAGGSPNPSGAAVVWYYQGMGKWTKSIDQAARFDDEQAAMNLVLLKDVLPRHKFTFIVVDQKAVTAELAAMDPAEVHRLRALAAELRVGIKGGYTHGEPPPLHEARVYKIGERQCLCRICVQRLLDLFPE